MLRFVVLDPFKHIHHMLRFLLLGATMQSCHMSRLVVLGASKQIYHMLRFVVLAVICIALNILKHEHHGIEENKVRYCLI